MGEWVYMDILNRAKNYVHIFTPYLMYEFFSSFDTAKWVRSLHYAGTEISLGAGHSLDLFYLYHLFDKGGLTAACHLLGIGYTFVF